MKRSRRVGLLMASTISVMALSGCYEEEPTKVDPAAHSSGIFQSVEACLADAKKTGASGEAAEGEAMSPLQKLEMACVEDWKKAEEEHVKNAPRFSDLASCEAEFGAGNCGAPGQSASGGGSAPVIVQNDGGSSFMPFMMGYMLSNMMQPSYPAYADRSGGWRSTTPSVTSSLKSSGATYVTSQGSRAPLASTSVSGGKVSAPKATMSQSTRAKSGGLGASRSSTGRSSFGG